jgi:hypothetical protein
MRFTWVFDRPAALAIARCDAPWPCAAMIAACKSECARACLVAARSTRLRASFTPTFPLDCVVKLYVTPGGFQPLSGIGVAGSRRPTTSLPSQATSPSAPEPRSAALQCDFGAVLGSRCSLEAGPRRSAGAFPRAPSFQHPSRCSRSHEGRGGCLALARESLRGCFRRAPVVTMAASCSTTRPRQTAGPRCVWARTLPGTIR